MDLEVDIELDGDGDISVEFEDSKKTETIKEIEVDNEAQEVEQDVMDDEAPSREPEVEVEISVEVEVPEVNIEVQADQSEIYVNVDQGVDQHSGFNDLEFEMNLSDPMVEIECEAGGDYEVTYEEQRPDLTKCFTGFCLLISFASFVATIGFGIAWALNINRSNLYIFKKIFILIS